MKIEAITPATAKNGSIYHKLTIGGKTYNYFGDLCDIKLGDEIEPKFEQKGAYNNLVGMDKIEAGSVAQGSTVAKHDIVVQRTEKPHSYEFGKAGARHKIYYNDVSELKEHIDMLKTAELIENEFQEEKIN